MSAPTGAIGRASRTRTAALITARFYAVPGGNRSDEAMRRDAIRQATFLAEGPGSHKRIMALVAMGPPAENEAARLVAEFLARKGATECPARAAEPVNNGLGFRR